MNNSSAYTTVLLKPTAQPQAVHVPVSKSHDGFRDDQATANFQQNFNDAHDNLRDEKSAKPIATKNTTHTNSCKSAVEIDESSSKIQVQEGMKNTDANNSSAEQISNIENAKSSKTTDKKVAVVEDLIIDTLQAAFFSDNTIVSAPQADTSLADVALGSILVTDNAKIPVTFNTESASGAAANSAAIDSNIIQVDSTKNLIPSLTDLKIKSDQVISGVDGVPIVSETDILTSGTQQGAVDASLSPAFVSIPAQVVIIEQAPADLAVGKAVLAEQSLSLSTLEPPSIAQAALVPPSMAQPTLLQASVAQTPLAPLMDDVTLVDAPSGLPDLIGTEKQLTKVAAGTFNAAVELDAALVPIAKSTFEKTLQNLTSPESARLDESKFLPVDTPISSTTSSSTNTLDSILRFSDSQAPAARSFVVQTAVPVPVGQPQWSQAVGEKVLWLAAQNVSAAEIHLNPENLGPMQVKVSVNQEQTTISFTSSHAVVREVLDQNLGRLRDMFSEQGLNLVNVDVSDKSFSRQQGDTKGQNGQTGVKDIDVEDDIPVAVSAIVQQRLVDHYA